MTDSPLLVSKSQYCRMRGIDPALLTRRITDGLITTEGPRELVDVAKADAALMDALGAAGRKVPARKGSTAARPGSGRRPQTSAGGGITLHEARTIRAREDAERARLAKEREAIELSTLRGEVCSIDDVAQAVGECFSNARAKWLAAPSKYASLIAPDDPARAFKALTAAVLEVLVEISEQAEAEITRLGGRK